MDLNLAGSLCIHVRVYIVGSRWGGGGAGHRHSQGVVLCLYSE